MPPIEFQSSSKCLRPLPATLSDEASSAEFIRQTGSPPKEILHHAYFSRLPDIHGYKFEDALKTAAQACVDSPRMSLNRLYGYETSDVDGRKQKDIETSARYLCSQPTNSHIPYHLMVERLRNKLINQYQDNIDNINEVKGALRAIANGKTVATVKTISSEYDVGLPSTGYKLTLSLGENKIKIKGLSPEKAKRWPGLELSIDDILPTKRNGSNDASKHWWKMCSVGDP